MAESKKETEKVLLTRFESMLRSAVESKLAQKRIVEISTEITRLHRVKDGLDYETIILEDTIEHLEVEIQNVVKSDDDKKRSKQEKKKSKKEKVINLKQLKIELKEAEKNLNSDKTLELRSELDKLRNPGIKAVDKEGKPILDKQGHEVMAEEVDPALVAEVKKAEFEMDIFLYRMTNKNTLGKELTDKMTKIAVDTIKSENFKKLTTKSQNEIKETIEEHTGKHADSLHYLLEDDMKEHKKRIGDKEPHILSSLEQAASNYMSEIKIGYEEESQKQEKESGVKLRDDVKKGVGRLLNVQIAAEVFEQEMIALDSNPDVLNTPKLNEALEALKVTLEDAPKIFNKISSYVGELQKADIVSRELEEEGLEISSEANELPHDQDNSKKHKLHGLIGERDALLEQIENDEFDKEEKPERNKELQKLNKKIKILEKDIQQENIQLREVTKGEMLYNSLAQTHGNVDKQLEPKEVENIKKLHRAREKIKHWKKKKNLRPRKSRIRVAHYVGVRDEAMADLETIKEARKIAQDHKGHEHGSSKIHDDDEIIIQKDDKKESPEERKSRERKSNLHFKRLEKKQKKHVGWVRHGIKNLPPKDQSDIKERKLKK